MFHKRPRMLFCNILAIALAVGCISPQGAVSMATGTTEAKTDTTQTDDGSPWYLQSLPLILFDSLPDVKSPIEAHLKN